MSNSTATVQLNSSFDRGAGLPHMLQLRLDTWRKDAPKSQFQQDGPLNAYLQGHKFPSGSFLVKPQALLRCLASDAQAIAHEKREKNPEKPTPTTKGKKKAPRYSIDSHNALVTDKRLYPDFDIDQCYSVGELTCDVIRIVVEVGSSLDGNLSAAHDLVELSLRRYLRAVGSRARGHLLGIGIVANKACLVDIRSETKGWMNRDLDIPAGDLEWFSLFDRSFVQALDKMKEFCEQDQPFGDLEGARIHSSEELAMQQDYTESDSHDPYEDVDGDIDMTS